MSETPQTKKRKSLRTTIIVAAAVVVLAGGVISLLAYRYYFGSAVARDGYLYVPTGADFREETDSLLKNGFLTDPARFETYAKAKGVTDRVRSGRYKLTEGMSYRALFGMLQRGEQAPVNLTFNNIRTKERLAAVVSRYIEPDSVQLLYALNDPAVAARYGFTGETFAGMFIPDTYQFYWNTSAEGFLDRMQKEYEKFWNTDREKKREAIGLTRNEVITLASIVREETIMSDEMPRVAGVYMNRLKIGMLLQADPTLKFAVGDFSIRRVLDIHKEVESPYNTYKYAGLPPGPICIPPIKAIDSVLDYESHNYYYFCAREDFSGYHNFARTLPEHNRNAALYHAALNRRGIRR